MKPRGSYGWGTHPMRPIVMLYFVAIATTIVLLLGVVERISPKPVARPPKGAHFLSY